jgi:hypothetical protein
MTSPPPRSARTFEPQAATDAVFDPAGFSMRVRRSAHSHVLPGLAGRSGHVNPFDCFMF